LILFSSTQRVKQFICGSFIGAASAIFLPNTNVPSALTDQAMLPGAIPQRVSAALASAVVVA